MASNIISSTIDGNFPVAGQDNDSQGFRDNFTIIKTSLASAATEVTDLQDNTAKTNADNNFLGRKIINAELDQIIESVKDQETITLANANIDFTFGHYQRFKIEGTDTTFTLTGFPAVDGDGKYAKLTVELVADGTDRTISWLGASSAFKFDSNWPSTFNVTSATDPVIVEFFTYDGGVVIFGRYLGQFSTAS